MKATDLLKRRVIGFVSGSNVPKLSRRDWLGFLLFVIAGGRTVVMNAEFRNGTLILHDKAGGRVINNKFTAVSLAPPMRNV